MFDVDVDEENFTGANCCLYNARIQITNYDIVID